MVGAAMVAAGRVPARATEGDDVGVAAVGDLAIVAVRPRVGWVDCSGVVAFAGGRDIGGESRCVRKVDRSGVVAFAGGHGLVVSAFRSDASIASALLALRFSPPQDATAMRPRDTRSPRTEVCWGSMAGIQLQTLDHVASDDAGRGTAPDGRRRRERPT